MRRAPCIDAAPSHRHASVPASRESATAGSDHELAAAVLERALRDSGVSERQLAYLCGVSRSRVRAWLEPASGASLSLHRIIGLAERAPTFWRALMRQLLELADEQPGPGLDPRAHVGLVAAELGDVARVTTTAMADGRVDEDEAADIDRELAQVERAASTARKDLRRVR